MGIFADLHGSGYDDLILACHNNGTHTDITSIIYFGGPEGLSENYRMELPAPNAIDVVAGDFNGDGKQELVFVSDDKLRMFYQSAVGFSPADLVDYDVNAVSLQNEDMVPEYRLLISEEVEDPEHFEELIPWQEEPVFHVEKDKT